jgi:PAS domain S-box-containing protein
MRFGYNALVPSLAVPAPPDFRALFESAPDAYLALAPDLTVVAASDAYLRVTGVERGEIVGRVLSDLVLADGFGSELRASLDRMLASGRVDILRSRRYGLGLPERSAGSRLLAGPLRLVHSPVYGEEGEIAYILHRIEEDAAATDGGGMENPVTPATPENADSRHEFLADLAHHLRNPLAPIVNSLHIARLPNVSDEQRESLRELTERQVLELTRLIDDLLDVSRLTSGKVSLQREHLDFSDLLRNAALAAGERLALRDLRLTLDLPEPPLWARADRVRLTQVLANLLENACAHSERGGEIAIGLGVEASGGGGAAGSAALPAASAASATSATSAASATLATLATWATEGADLEARVAVLTVRDHGAGIAADLLPRIFEPFSQGEVVAGDGPGLGGVGLGLALVRSLVGMHGGTIEAASEGPGRGSTFTLRLPLAREPVSEDPALWTDPEVRPHRILIIEDNVDAAESLRLFLELTGHSATVAHDGPQGVARARDTQPEVVLCDIGLPGEMDGYAVARALRRDPELAFTRLIALTGYGQAEDRRLASEAGFDLHLTKPTDPDALLRVLASFF